MRRREGSFFALLPELRRDREEESSFALLPELRRDKEGFSGKGPRLRSEKGLLDRGSDEAVVSSFLFFLDMS